MTTTQPRIKATVWLAPIAGYDRAYRMIWTATPTAADVQTVFNAIYAAQNAATSPIHIIVDLTENPTFPLGITMSAALKAHNHKHMGSWLVVGSNRVARLIGGFLTSFKKSIEWFDTDEAALMRLSNLMMTD